jgi:hypothetical protein
LAASRTTSDRLPALGNRAGKGGDLFLRAVDHARPFLGQMEADPEPVLRGEFGRHHAARESVLCHG